MTDHKGPVPVQGPKQDSRVIRVRKPTYDELARQLQPRETFDGLIQRLIAHTYQTTGRS